MLSISNIRIGLIYIKYVTSRKIEQFYLLGCILLVRIHVPNNSNHPKKEFASLSYFGRICRIWPQNPRDRILWYF